MKNLFYLVLLPLFVVSCSNDVSDQSLNTSEINLKHHSCDCTSSMGGTASATCKDSQNCSCSSGFFSCSCECSGDAISSEGDPGSWENWTAINNLLKTKRSKEAKQITLNLLEVYKLGKSDYQKFLIEAEKLNRIFEKLDEKTQEEMYRIIK